MKYETPSWRWHFMPCLPVVKNFLVSLQTRSVGLGQIKWSKHRFNNKKKIYDLFWFVLIIRLFSVLGKVGYGPVFKKKKKKKNLDHGIQQKE